ncbi:hypothetical protein PIB30_043482 [Stylosanthes scabra]|uniref:Uncharacterized protein n=1 Tax=Stylosanthes scabra TaxID=79078 RepID=A0ABU6ZEA7_9FABA|nr:hypothetical protein [Stylosanthes scabra]
MKHLIPTWMQERSRLLHLQAVLPLLQTIRARCCGSNCKFLKGFEAGILAIGEAIGLGAAIDYLSGIAMQTIHDYEVIASSPSSSSTCNQLMPTIWINKKNPVLTRIQHRSRLLHLQALPPQPLITPTSAAVATTEWQYAGFEVADANNDDDVEAFLDDEEGYMQKNNLRAPKEKLGRQKHFSLGRLQEHSSSLYMRAKT